ncbi:PDR/VanB family oxidoreductase [Mycobacterium sp. 852014-52144_SCH5372336]|uniref:PDR/VanB family oxidoreductase n=1 Tax=Mycobacterium sp. 852014-52144_SCH5372336 TaxID=1834115 RepID=UPI0007FD8A17|nr:PDR/VanB family oxidoreductase [Mycobacterium sp. 852014-52144_SCH5372336]OBB75892.1 oxidoreductase [Mycobacterium sp. 852014-52144_SCH5372336]
MNYLTAPTTDLDHPTHSLRVMGVLARGYSQLFAQGPLADTLSPPHPRRRTGFTMQVQVDHVCAGASDVVVVTLVRPGGAALPAWTPGAHIDVFTPQGRQRHYSLTGDPADARSYRIAVRRIPGGQGSAEMHQLRAGDALWIRGPRNAFPFTPEPAYHFIAAGIGITPILPMVQAAADSRTPWTMSYAGRTHSTLPFLDELAALDQRIALRVHLDEQQGPPSASELVSHMSPGSTVFMCGPPALTEAVATHLRGNHPNTRLHSERFTPPAVRNGTAFTVTLARSGRTVAVAADQSALTAIREVLPEVAYSCQQGFCGACKTRIVQGRAEHHDRVLLAEEQDDYMMICVSRAVGDAIVVDL